MLRNLKDLEGCAVGASDGVIGHVRDCYFDDAAWVIRYLIVDTGEPPRHHVLVSPIAVIEPDWQARIIPVRLTREQVKHCPDIDTDKPVSRQQEMGYLGYYGYGNYWGGSGLWGAGLYPDILQGGLQEKTNGGASNGGHQHVHGNDPHLRSANAVMRYYVHASDGDIGHVDGFLVEERTWAIRYLIVNTSNWWLGHQVLIAPPWINEVNWLEPMVMVGLTREAIKAAPAYDSSAKLDREQEGMVHAHYGRGAYWAEQDKSRTAASRP